MYLRKAILLFIFFLSQICIAQNDTLSIPTINFVNPNSEYGYSEKNGKFAITDKRKVISEYKYDDKYCNSYTEIDENNKELKIYVAFDTNKKEILKSKEKFDTVWDVNNYLTYDLKEKKYYFTYKNVKYLISKEFRECLFYPLPIESKIFINFENQTFHTLNSQIQNNKKYIPQTSFYKGKCIVLQGSNGKNVYKIINEKLKIVKVLKFDFKPYEGLFFGPVTNFNFNKYGQVLFLNSNSLDGGIIDYNGNFIYDCPNSKVQNSKIFEVYEGLYEIEELDQDENEKRLYMNQLGEKIDCGGCEFKKGIDENYLIKDGEIFRKIDLDNNFKI